MANKPQPSLKSEILPDKPKLFAIVMFNDDYISKEFVVDVLITIFNKEPEEAARMMMTIHRTGQCAVAVYSYDIAASKKLQTERMAEVKGYPMRLSISEVIG